MKNWKLISITTLGTLAIFGTAVLATTGTVNAPSGLVLRQEASSSGEPITTLPDDATVEVIEENGDWYKVTYNSQEGYAYAKYIEVEEEIKPETTQAVVAPENTTPEEGETTPVDGSTQAKNKLKVYNMPLITSTVINEIEVGAEVTIHKQITNWSYISVGNVEGWVRTYGIENETQVPSAENPEEPKVEEPTTTPENPTTEPEPETPTNAEPGDDTGTTEKPVDETKGFVAVDFANVRKQASTNSEIVTTLTKDTSFKISAETEEWYKITYTSPEGTVYEGYIYKNLVTK